MTKEESSWDPRDPNVMSFLVATDNHVGYNEKDPIRGQDSFNSFEEILQLSHQLQVDAILHGGDLFHENRPSRRSIHTTLELLRHYCLGDRPCALELLSDPCVNFVGRFGSVNWEDSNYNVSMPILGIHGNHDDPTGDNGLSAVDILSVAGVFNYFGKCKDVDDLVLSPILLRKGSTNLALYGLGNIRDERLYRQFSSQKVKMLRPATTNNDGQFSATGCEWFNLMLFHQNRIAHGPTGYIPEEFLDDSLDLVVWGHEHDCRIVHGVEYCGTRDFYVCQPGSSIATSLSEGEAGPKYVAHIMIKGTQFQVRSVPLRSVRPFVFDEVLLSDLNEKIISDSKALGRVLVQKVEAMIEKAKEEWHKRNSDKDIQQCPLPLIRLRVDPVSITNYALINPQRFGQLFVDKAANTRDILLHVRRRAKSGKSMTEVKLPEEKQGARGEKFEEVEVARVEDLVEQYLNLQKLSLLPQNEFSDMMRVFVEKDDRDALDTFVRGTIDRTTRSVSERPLTLIGNDGLKDEVTKEKVQREEEWRRIHPSSSSFVIEGKPVARKLAESDDIVGGIEGGRMEEDPGESLAAKPPASGRGRGRGRGRGGRATHIPFTLESENPSSSVRQSTAISPLKRTRTGTRSSVETKPAQLEFTMKSRAAVASTNGRYRGKATTTFEDDDDNDQGGVGNGGEGTFAAFTQQVSKKSNFSGASPGAATGLPSRRK